VRQAAGTQRLRSEYFGYFGFFVAAEIFSYESALGQTDQKLRTPHQSSSKFDKKGLDPSARNQIHNNNNKIMHKILFY
jgi:hypothetical protein